MRVELIRGADLSEDLINRWAQIQEANEEFASPYFRPEFTQAVASVRDDVFVGVLENAGRPIGFFPFHRRRGGIGRPVGLGLSDYHGVIVEPRALWTAEELLRGCGLVRYEFDHLIASQEPFEPWHTQRAASPVIQLDGGYAKYVESRDRKGRKQLREIERKRDRLESQISPVRFVEHSTDAAPLQSLFEWKSDKCRSSGVYDFFSLAWTRRLIEGLKDTQTDEFGGKLACLYVGERLLAVHFLMRTKRVWHSWFPAYDERFAQYSPGRVLLLDLIREAADNGIEWIDLGKGTSTYKAQMMTGAIDVAEGRLEISSFVNRIAHVRDSLERLGRHSALRPLLSVPSRLAKRKQRRLRYD